MATMSTLLIGTDSGIFRLTADGNHVQEAGPPDGLFFAVTPANETFAITRKGALWARQANGAWQLKNERAVADEVWSFAAEPRLDGRLRRRRCELDGVRVGSEDLGVRAVDVSATAARPACPLDRHGPNGGRRRLHGRGGGWRVSKWRWRRQVGEPE